jgi:hypothetical protein
VGGAAEGRTGGVFHSALMFADLANAA